MSSGGGKGGSQNTTSEVKLDPDFKRASLDALDAAAAAAGMPYQPNRGIQVAGFKPQDMAFFRAADTASAAFGLPTGGYTPPPVTQGAGGFSGYGIGNLYDQALAQSYSQPFLNEMAKLYADPETGVRGDPNESALFRSFYGDKGGADRSGGSLLGHSGGATVVPDSREFSDRRRERRDRMDRAEARERGRRQADAIASGLY